MVVALLREWQNKIPLPVAYKSKKKQAAASKRHYERNKKKIIARSYERTKKHRKWARDYVDRVKQMFHCVDCGESEDVLLDFDHVRGEKRENISDMVYQGYSIKSIKDEIRKCEVRCANCHRRKTRSRKRK